MSFFRTLKQSQIKGLLCSVRRRCLTRLFHVCYDPVKSHFRSHVSCVVHRLPAGLQWKAHLRQLHHRRLIYLWSWGRDKATSTAKYTLTDSTLPQLKQANRFGKTLSLGLITQRDQRKISLRAASSQRNDLSGRKKKGAS